MRTASISRSTSIWKKLVGLKQLAFHANVFRIDGGGSRVATF